MDCVQGVHVNISVHSTHLHMEAVVLNFAKLFLSKILSVKVGQNIARSPHPRALLSSVLKGQWCDRPFGINILTL